MKLERCVEGTYLYADAGISEIRNFLLEAANCRIAAVSVTPFYAKLSRLLLQESPVLTYACIDFPLGQTTPSSKAFAAREAYRIGAEGVEVMANIPMIKEHDYDYLRREFSLIRKTLGPSAEIRAVIETSLLSPEEIALSAVAVQEGGASGIVTGTAYGKKGVKEPEVRLLRKVLGPGFFVKASGGIRDLSQAKILLSAGASAVSTSRPGLLFEL